METKQQGIPCDIIALSFKGPCSQEFWAIFIPNSYPENRLMG